MKREMKCTFVDLFMFIYLKEEINLFIKRVNYLKEEIKLFIKRVNYFHVICNLHDNLQ